MNTIRLLIACLTLLLLCPDVEARAEEGAIQLRQGVNGEPVVAMDILAAFRNERVQDASLWGRPFVAVTEAFKATGRYAVDSPGNFVKTAAVSYLLVRGAQGRLDDDWDSLRRRTGMKSSRRDSGKNGGTYGDESSQGIIVSIGDGNENLTIVIQQPGGDNFGGGGRDASTTP